MSPPTLLREFPSYLVQWRKCFFWTESSFHSGKSLCPPCTISHACMFAQMHPVADIGSFYTPFSCGNNGNGKLLKSDTNRACLSRKSIVESGLSWKHIDFLFVSPGIFRHAFDRQICDRCVHVAVSVCLGMWRPRHQHESVRASATTQHP